MMTNQQTLQTRPINKKVQPLHQQKEEIKDKIEWEQGLDF
jgi:hypothetical protein